MIANEQTRARNMAQSGRMLVISRHNVPGSARKVKEIAKFFSKWPEGDADMLETARLRRRIMETLAEAEKVFAQEKKAAEGELAPLKAKSMAYGLGGLAVGAGGAVWSFVLNWPSMVKGIVPLEKLNEIQMASMVSVAASAIAEMASLGLAVYLISKHFMLSDIVRKAKNDIQKVEDFITQTKRFLNDSWAKEMK